LIKGSIGIYFTINVRATEESVELLAVYKLTWMSS